MMKPSILLAAAALPLALAACPLPQPLAEVARTADGGTVSTPVILPETAQPAGTVVPVRTDCDPPARFTLSATVEDLDTEEVVEARWFVDWVPDRATLLAENVVPASGDPSDPRRAIPPLPFSPYTYDSEPLPGTTHVVEVVVSNGFLPSSDPTQPFQRAAAPPFVTQSYRWVFQYVDATDTSGRCQ
jgi:hypothetical protein